jgi:UDP-2,3-diacylglucosamine pyrophosphatase LpxH
MPGVRARHINAVKQRRKWNKKSLIHSVNISDVMAQDASAKASVIREKKRAVIK